MNINYELYRIFYTVAKVGNITKASKELMISQPAISKSIKNLEEQLGGELFTRTQKGVILTKEGAEFYTYIAQAINFIDNAESRFSSLINLDTGKINIGVSTTKLVSGFLMGSLSDFHKLYPKIKIEVFTADVETLVNKLRNGLLDVLVIMSPFDDLNDLSIIKCREMDLCFISNIKQDKIKLEDLNNYPLILPVLGYNDRTLIDKYAHSNGVYLNPELELSSYSLIRDFTVAGFGVGVLPEIAIEADLIANKLYKVNVTPKPPKCYIGIASLKKKEMSFSTQKLIDIITYKYNI